MPPPQRTSQTERADADAGTAEAPQPPRTAAPLGGASGVDTAGRALGLVVVIIVAEYLARRILAPMLPTIGDPIVNDMLMAALIYGLLVTVVVPRDARSPAALVRSLRGIAATATTWLAWIGGVLFLGSVVALMFLDTQLWGNVELPSFTAPASSIVLFAGAATPLAIISLLLVNGIVIPLAEERLWRGIVQPGLRAAWGVAPALILTASLFSLKHAIVDASLGRLLALTVGGLMLGLVAYRAGGPEGGRSGWRTSSVSHMVANIVATSLALAAGAL